jgi:hypothetical protein
VCNFIIYSRNLSFVHVTIFLAIILRIPAIVVEVETIIIIIAGAVTVSVDNNNPDPATIAEND